MLSGGLSIARDRRVDEHGFTQRRIGMELRPSLIETRQRRFHIIDPIESLQNNAVEMARDKIEHGGLEQARTVVKMDRCGRPEAQSIVLRVQVEILGQSWDVIAL